MNKAEKIKEISDRILIGGRDKSIYDGFDETIYGDTLEPGSMPAPKFYEWVIDQTNNRLNGEAILAIEVGTFLGYSAIGFAKKMKEYNSDSKLICIDTFLGSAEHYNKKTGVRDERLGIVNGYPTMYQKFLANAIYHNVDDIIVPLPLPSATAYKVLREMFDSADIYADFAYIDGSHEENEVYMDLYHYYHLIKDDAYLYGDDWAWESVRGDVSKFSEDNSLNLNVFQNNVHWAIEKNKNEK